MTINIF